MNPSPSSPEESARSLFRRLVALAVLTIAVRVVLLLFYFGIKHGTWEEFIAISDAGSFLRMGRVLVLGESPQILSFYDARVFPGWPLLIGILLPILSDPVALFSLTLGCAAGVSCLFFLITRSFPASVIVAVAPPVWLISGVHPMGEPAFLFACLAALFAATRGAWLVAGVFGGAACVIKPYGIFAAGGLAWFALFCTAHPFRISATLRLISGAVLPVGAVAAINFLRLGNVAPQLQVYSAPLDQLNIPHDTALLLGNPSGHWDWPLKALVLTPLRVATPWWKIVYVYAHAIAMLGLCLRAFAKSRVQNAPWERACLIWLVGNTLASFSAGPYWGFHAFDRYVIWAWPAAAALNLDLFKPKLIPAVALISFAAAAFSILGR